MALGVLNNLSAIYAENNLNNTSNSLQNVLEQLSSGSKINSGADDAAGLSLVNGLAANSSALTQSETNATEGVGLLQVADGALSQVTSLLDRAITLATEASNGTLNSTQENAANQEYQSIMSEVNNIGQTTTYNQQQVFDGQQVSIYTGDSSSAGSSVDELNIRSLSESSVGDTDGQMAYSDAQNNTFIDLSKGGVNAGVTDSLNTSGTSSLSVDYLVKGANGANTTATTTITVGSGTNYFNTAQGLISAIDNSGLGITASFTTAAAAGDTSATQSTDTGIEISGSVGAGATPSTASFSGTVTAKNATDSDTLTGAITITDGNGAPQQILMSSVLGSGFNPGGTGAGTSTLDGLVNYINYYSSTDPANATETDAFGVHASDAGGVLTLTSATGADVANTSALSVTTDLTDSSATVPTMNYTAIAAYSVGLNQPALATAAVFDSTTGQLAAASINADSRGSGGVATISYTDGAGENLSTTDLTNQSSAQTALNDLNVAVTDVASMDGYIGAQINTLNSISQVMTTQQENVTSAQNAIQATDYASATSNMSKYEILSQTGIAALAQANSVQQEVTKLLQ
jgi:flagellin